MTKKYKVTDIQWCCKCDTPCVLPSECTVEIDLADYGYHDDIEAYREDEADLIVDEVTERYSHLIYGLSYEEILD